MDTLQRAHPLLRRGLIQRNIWEGYERHIFGLQPILRKMSARGLPIDNQAREELGVAIDQLKEATFNDLQSMHPDELKNCLPKHGYIRDPQDTTGMARRKFSVIVKKKPVNRDLVDRKSTRLNSSHIQKSRMPSSA